MNTPAWLISLIIFLPTLGVLPILAFNKRNVDLIRMWTVFVTAVTFVLTLLLVGQFNFDDPGIQPVYRLDEEGEVAELLTDYSLDDGLLIVGEEQLADEDIQRGFSASWIGNWNIFYKIGYDGISLPLVLLTGFISVLAAMASWSINKLEKGYFILFLLLETGMLGVFLALDFFLFYVFWEVMLLPMYFLIGIWGGPRKEYAAIKFFIYTLAGGVLMLIAMLMFYFNSGSSFDLQYLAEVGQGQIEGVTFSQTVQIAAFILLFIGFAIKLPSFPFHTWLPDAHVEAPTPISMILAGVLLKMGGYGIIRIAFPLCPVGAQYAAYVLVLIGAFSIIYGAFAALAQTDFKRMVAYSSVSHMGYVLIGFAVWKINEAGAAVRPDYWQQGLSAAMFQMIGHGVSSAGMFFIVGVIYDRVHHRDLNRFGGLIALMPLYSALAFGIFFAGLGLPGMCGFIGEALVVLSMWNYDPLLAIIAASGVILTAGYILWTLQRVFLGPEYVGPHKEDIVPINSREATIAGVLLLFAIVLGVYPQLMFGIMDNSIAHLVESMDAGYQAALQTASDVQAALGR